MVLQFDPALTEDERTALRFLSDSPFTTLGFEWDSVEMKGGRKVRPIRKGKVVHWMLVTSDKTD